MSVLVAGGAGYIGSITAEELLAAGFEVVVYDNLSRGHRAAVPDGAAFVEGDLGDAATLARAFRDHRVTAVMHFAAHSLVPESMTDPSIYFHNNVEVGRIILDTMLREGVPFLVFSSTCATFGEPETVPITEDLPQRPTSPYGESKLMFERMLHWYHRIHGLNCCVLRYFNAAGASATRGEAGLRLDLRRRLPDARRDVHPRLHPHPRPGPGAHPGAANQGGRRDALQPGERRGLFRPRGDRRLPQGHRPRDPGGRRAAPPGRPAGPDRRVGEGPPRTGLDAANPVARRDRPERVGVAPTEAGRVRAINTITNYELRVTS